MKRENDEGVNSLHYFQQHSRLHFIGQWKTKMDDLLATWFRAHPEWNHGNLVQQRLFVHIDMDAFFCSVQLAKPENAGLRAKPVAIAAGRYNSDISSCNYVARQHGVRAGMYVNSARERCPQLITLGYDLPACEAVAKTLYRILFDNFPRAARMSMEVYSIDEVMVATDSNDYDLLRQFCVNVRRELERVTGCTASCGIAPNIMLARIATHRAKPNGIYMMHRDEVTSIMQRMPFRDIHGVGRRVAAKVRQLLVARHILHSAASEGASSQEGHIAQPLPTKRPRQADDATPAPGLRTGPRGRSDEVDDKAAANGDGSDEEGEDESSSDGEEASGETILCAHVQRLSREELQRALGKKAGDTLYHMCRGEDMRVVRRTGDVANKRALGQHLPNSVGCTMNYAVRPTSREDVWHILGELLATVCAKLRRGGFTTTGLRVTLLERHPLHPKQTPKYMGRGYCIELHLPVRFSHPLGDADAAAMMSGIREAVEPLLVESRRESDAERAAQLGLLDDVQGDRGWTSPVDSVRDMVIEDLRGMSIQAGGLKRLEEEEGPARKAAGEQISLAAAFSRAATATHAEGASCGATHGIADRTQAHADAAAASASPRAAMDATSLAGLAQLEYDTVFVTRWRAGCREACRRADLALVRAFLRCAATRIAMRDVDAAEARASFVELQGYADVLLPAPVSWY